AATVISSLPLHDALPIFIMSTFIVCLHRLTLVVSSWSLTRSVASLPPSFAPSYLEGGHALKCPVEVTATTSCTPTAGLNPQVTRFPTLHPGDLMVLGIAHRPPTCHS